MGRKPIEHIPCMRPNEGVNRAGSMLDTLTDPRDTCILLTRLVSTRCASCAYLQLVRLQTFRYQRGLYIQLQISHYTNTPRHDHSTHRPLSRL